MPVTIRGTQRRSVDTELARVHQETSRAPYVEPTGHEMLE